MATPKAPNPPRSADYERGRAAGIFEAIQAGAALGKLCLDAEEMCQMAERLEAPVLFVECALGHEFDDLTAMADWWSTRKGA